MLNIIKPIVILNLNIKTKIDIINSDRVKISEFDDSGYS